MTIGVLGLLMRTKLGNRFTVVMKNRFSKLTRAISVAKITTPNVATVVLENYFIIYGAPDIILTDNGKQFTSGYFAALCVSFGTIPVTSTEYNSQTNRQVERYSRTLVAILRQYIDELQQNCDMFVQLQTYTYNIQKHRMTGATPFSLTLRREPPGSFTLSKIRLQNGKYTNLLSQHVKIKETDHLHHLMQEAGKKSSKALYI